MPCQGQLVFDSARARDRAGAASDLVVERTLLYRADGLAVDVVLQEGSGPLTVLHGQVVDERAGRALAAAQVRLGEQAPAVETDLRGRFAVSAAHAEGEQPLWIEAPGRRVRCSLPARSQGA